jgi:ATP-dependent Clp protease ATP-binding subunit ClpA
VSRKLDSACLASVEAAKAALPDGSKLDVGTMMAALVWTSHLKADFTFLTQVLPQPRPVRVASGPMPLDESLQPLISELLAGAGPDVTVKEFFLKLTESEAGRKVLQAIPESQRHELAAGLGQKPRGQPSGAWRESEERKAALAALAPFGRALTDRVLDERPFDGRADELGAVVRALCKPKRRNALVIGQAGSGKTALVRELARRIARGGDTLPARVRDIDIFEIFPTKLKAESSLAGQYEARLQALVDVLKQHPQIVVFIDEIHSFLQSSVHHRGTFSEANESLKASLGHGDIACIGCTTLSEFRHYIEPDDALVRRFKIIRLAPPTRHATLSVLQRRTPGLQSHFEVQIPSALLDRTIDLSERHLPGRSQPDKSLQLLEDACAFACTQAPPQKVLGEEALLMAIEDVIGHTVVRSGQLTEDAVFARLRERFVGQDKVLGEISRAFVAGLSEIMSRKGPRGVFLFSGPSGAGKTEVAVELSRLLCDTPALIQVNCNALTGGIDGGPVQSVLFGPPPGYVGYARGQGGLLSRIRDMPESVVLFDELDKASPRLHELLLQIIDKGVIEDLEGRQLDFSRAFIIFTSNGGWKNQSRRLPGFGAKSAAEEPKLAEVEAVRQALAQEGMAPEFIGRIRHFFVFQPLSREAMATVIARQLGQLGEKVRAQGLGFEWNQSLIPHLLANWEPRLGARHLHQIVQNRVVEQIGVADAQGELATVRTIRLEVMENASEGRPGEGRVEREQRESVLVLRFG